MRRLSRRGPVRAPSRRFWACVRSPPSPRRRARRPRSSTTTSRTAAGQRRQQAFEAQSASEFGGQVEFAGTARHNPRLTATMSSWGCQSGGLGTHDCSTTPGAKFSLPIRFNVYRVGAATSPAG